MEWISANAIPILTLVSLIIGIITFAKNGKKDAVQDAKDDSKQDATILVELGHISQVTQDIRADLKEQRNEITQIKIDVARTDDSVKSAHHRIDFLEHRGDGGDKKA